MQRGRIRQVGTPQSVYGEPRDRFVASCVGHLPMNFVSGQVSVVGHLWRFCGAGLQVVLPAGASRYRWVDVVELGVRPEQVRLAPAGVGSDRDGRDGQSVCGRGVVVHREMLGDQELMHVTLQGGEESGATNRLICQDRPGCAAELGGVVDVIIEPEQVHLFDGTSGASLRRVADETLRGLAVE